LCYWIVTDSGQVVSKTLVEHVTHNDYLNEDTKAKVKEFERKLEFRLAPCFQNDNGPAERLKLLESLANHRHVQKKIISAIIPDLVSLDI
jgi:hypothetical protein